MASQLFDHFIVYHLQNPNVTVNTDVSAQLSGSQNFVNKPNVLYFYPSTTTTQNCEEFSQFCFPENVFDAPAEGQE